MNQKIFIVVFCLLTGLTAIGKIQAQILGDSLLNDYVEKFNQQDEELYKQYISNDQAKDFLEENIPLFECPDKTIEEIYYFRWWTFRKHLKKTPDGFIITEFLPDVSWAGKYNGICCPAWFHFREGRWLHDTSFLDDYTTYWLKGGGALRSYSFPITDAIYQYCQVVGSTQPLIDYYPDLLSNYMAWKEEKFVPEVGLFWQTDNRDGMEISIGGNGFRATINSYMLAELSILSELATLRKDSIATKLKMELNALKKNFFQKLWDNNANFFKVLPQEKNAVLQNVRELHGYTPWAFNLAESQYAEAWKFLMNTRHFLAPYGLTTAEQCHPDFQIAYEGHECQWNGPSWPYATSMTLIGLANLLNTQQQDYITSRDYVMLLNLYARSQYRILDNGICIPWIDENLNPFIGDWISRSMLQQRKQIPQERGRDYNHSSFCDLVITGLIGLRPQVKDTLVVNPLLEDKQWDYFCLDKVYYHGKMITIMYDRTGKKYNKGVGLSIFVNGEKVLSSSVLKKVSYKL